ncbi:hypothetical protein G6O69_20215 [Pseudenhygromyxa sp. WMMC2535]|uniref:DNA polymerase n=1 Tax=Pseudenhygromyxa sp. WMMC2535 TaxID=2712867 RepID=UPI00155506E1|nr:DNA polymerase [Pseudenhygromyxa sp. WMMC2535]NVB40183.1 hypothetical protein [Pseudenhygromyxa sp. WMMC2535]
MLERIVARGPKVLGVAMELRTRQGARLRSGDDHRGASLEAVAIAVPEPRDGSGEGATGVKGSGTKVLVLERDALAEGGVAVLEGLWAGVDEPPYLVFADAHRSLALLAGAGVSRPPRYGCVTVAATLLAEGADRRRDHRPLDRLVREHLERELPEGGLLLQTNNHERVASEAEALLALLEHMTPQLRERRLARVFQFECELLPAVVDMESTGIAVDAPGFERVASSWVRERSEIAAQDEAERDAARVARLDKLISTYRWWARDFVDPDHRIRCRLHPLAADSGRFACTDPNLQQVPSEHTAPGLRGCFVPAPGHTLIIADYAQIELRVAAHMAPCEALRAVFRAGRDPHRATAANLAGKPEHAIDAHERKLAKAVNFGFLFGMGARRFSEYARDSYGLELDEAAAAGAREAFFRTFPGISAWHRRIRGLSRRGDHEAVTVTTAMGRRRTFPAGRFSYNAALNIPVQGSAAEGFKLAMVRLHRELAAIGGRGVLVVHDEYLAEVPSARAEEGKALVERVMIAAMAELIDTVPIVVEAEIAERWS